MDTNLNRVASDLVDEKLGEFPNLVIKDKENKPIPTTMDDQIANARIFDFEFVRDNVNFGPVTITISNNDGLQIKTYSDPVEDRPDEEQDVWYEFVKSMGEFATDHILQFKGHKVVTKKITPKSEVGESKMTESRLVGTSRTSYQDLGEATLIVKHSKPINYNAANGRTQHIESIYIENALGERFRYPMKHLNGARALASHIIEGGTPYDDIGQYIIGLSEELGKLRMFKGYVTRSPMVAEAMGSVTGRVIDRMESIKKELAHLQNKKHYAEWAESFSRKDNKEIPDEIAAEWIDRLTVKSFNEDLKTVFPYLLNIIEESDLPVKELDAQELLDSNSQVQELIDPEREIRELADLENFIDNIVREDRNLGLLSKDNLRQSEAAEELNKLIQDNMDAVVGLQGENGKSLVKKLIPDDALLDEIEDRASESAEGSSTPLWPIVKDFVEFKMPEMLKDNGGALDFEPAPAEAPAAEPAAAPAAEPAAAPAAAPAATVPAQQESWQGALETKLYKIKSLAEENGRDFDTVRLTINGKSYSLSEALMAFEVSQPINEADAEDEFKKMAMAINKGSDSFDIIYSALGRDDEVGKKLQDMVNDIAYEKGLHADDDIEKIIDIITDELESKFGNDIPFDGPYSQSADVTDKSGAKHTPMSRARHLARQGRDSLAKQILERVKSFTNLVPERIDQGPFPLGEEGVITKVTKDLCEKYGKEKDDRFKQAVEAYCRECVGQLSSVYETYRMRKLAGMSEQSAAPYNPDGESAPPPKGKDGKYPMVTSGPNKGKRWSPQTPGPTLPPGGPGFTPEKAQLDPRYKTDPAFKREVDMALQIGNRKMQETLQGKQSKSDIDRIAQLAGLRLVK